MKMILGLLLGFTGSLLAAEPAIPSTPTPLPPQAGSPAASNVKVFTGTITPYTPPPTTLSGKILQSLPNGKFLLHVKGSTIMVTGMPADFVIKNGSTIEVKVDPTNSPEQLRTSAGATRTIDSFRAVERPQVRK